LLQENDFINPNFHIITRRIITARHRAIKASKCVYAVQNIQHKSKHIKHALKKEPGDGAERRWCEKGGDDYMVLKATRWYGTARWRDVMNTSEVSAEERSGEKESDAKRSSSGARIILRCFVTIKCI
jgi:hypothetical protein